MADHMKNLLIGIFTATALAIIIFMILFLHPYVGDEGQTMRVRFTDIDKVSVGTRVLLAGNPVGEVKKIKLLDEVSQQRIERLGDIYVYELELAVDSSLRVYNTDRISLRTSGLLGEKSVSIDPEPLQPGQQMRLINDEIIYAEGTGSVEDTFKDFKEIAEKIELALDLITETLSDLKEKGTWDNIANTAENLSELSTRLIEAWPDVEESVSNMTEITTNAKEVSNNLVKGEGSIGKLLSKDDLYLRTTSLLSKGETILDDVNHYGVLFHLDKGWQRLRARRMNLLQKLQTPQEFRNYFNDEIGQVTTSLSRVEKVLEKSENYPILMDNKEYQKVFSELLRRVEGLEEALQMYNNQIVDEANQRTELSKRRL